MKKIKMFFGAILIAFMFFGLTSTVSVNAASVTEPTDEWALENGWEITDGQYRKTVDDINYKLYYGRNRYEQKIKAEPDWRVTTLSSPNASGKVVILSEIDGFPVKAVGADTFKNNSKITECIISEGVEYVGESAFQVAANITNISLPSTLKMIDGGAFYMAWDLKKIVIPAEVDYLAKNAFTRNNSGEGIESVLFLGNAPEILYTGVNTSNTLIGVNGVEFYHMEGTTGWDAPCWAVLNPKVYVESEGPEAPAKPEKIVLDKVSVELETGESTKVTAAVVPEDAEEKEVTWESADESIATVKNGVITGVKAGETKVTARCGDVLAEVTVKVSDKPEVPVKPLGLVLDKTEVELEPWGHTEVKVTGFPEGFENTAVEWDVEDHRIAQVVDGIILGIIEGETKVTARCGDSSAEVIVRVKKAEEPENPEIGDNHIEKLFSDVKEGSWYIPYMQYTYDRELILGTGELLKPEEGIRRAQFVTVLYRLAGNPDVEDRSALEYFKDVDESSYYADALCWAYATGLTTGNENTKCFDPNGSLTREQVATFIYRFFGQMGGSAENVKECRMYGMDEVHSYAKEAVEWCVSMGIITGKEVWSDGVCTRQLAPQDGATRAQISKIIYSFSENTGL